MTRRAAASPRAARALLALALAAQGAACSATSSPAGPADGAADDAREDAPDADDHDSRASRGAWAWPVCDAEAGAPGSLAEKARHLDALVRAQHLEDGLLRSVRLDAAGGVASLEHLPSTGLWTAIYLASQAFRHAVTGDPEAVENARVAVAGLHDLTAVTGVPGLYGRAFQRPGFTYAYDAAASGSWVPSPAPGYEGWWFDDDVSKDTMDGIVFGYAVALELLDDPQVRDVARADLLAFVDHLVGHGLRIVDHTGEVTEHGRLFYAALDDFPGFNALLASAWVKVAADEGARPDLARFYDDCLMRLGPRDGCPLLDGIDLGSYLDAIEQALFLYLPDCKTSYDNLDMAFQAIWPLLRHEARPALRDRLLAVLRVGIWEPTEPGLAPPVHRAGHALYTFMYGALAAPPPDDAPFRAAMEDALCTLHRLPADRADRAVLDGAQEPACVNRLDHPNAAEVVPLEERDVDNYLWRLDPYEIPRARPAVPGLVHSPEDFLLAYWLGRWAGLVPPDL